MFVSSLIMTLVTKRTQKYSQQFKAIKELQEEICDISVLKITS